MNSSEQGSSSSGAGGSKMEWMYKETAMINREDYLMGRSVDKSFQLLEAVEKGNDFSYADEVEKDLTPLSIFASKGPTGPIDIIKKIKEDPLYQIQKKEEENLKQLLKNPIRMKQLREEAEKRERLTSQSSNSSKSTKSSKKKKHKKHKKRESSSSSSSDSDTEKHSKSKTSKFEEIDKLLSAKLHSLKDKDKDHKKRHGHDEEPSRHKHEHHHHHHDNYNYDNYEHRRQRRSRSRSRSRERERDRSRRRSNDRNHVHPTRDNKYKSSSSSSAPVPEKRKPLDAEEIERRRQEMMSNAKWRDEQRSSNVSKYREAAKKEEEQSKTNHDPDFIRKQLIEAATTGSVEKRIKSNAYNIQKSSHSMNQNFARR